MTQCIELTVHLAYDDEAQVWYVAKSDIPGLSLEAATAPVLIDRVTQAAPELIELNAKFMPHLVGAGKRDSIAPCPWALRPVFDDTLALAC